MSREKWITRKREKKDQRKKKHGEHHKALWMMNEIWDVWKWRFPEGTAVLETFGHEHETSILKGWFLNPRKRFKKIIIKKVLGRAQLLHWKCETFPLCFLWKFVFNDEQLFSFNWCSNVKTKLLTTKIIFNGITKIKLCLQGKDVTSLKQIPVTFYLLKIAFERRFCWRRSRELSYCAIVRQDH